MHIAAEQEIAQEHENNHICWYHCHDKILHLSRPVYEVSFGSDTKRKVQQRMLPNFVCAKEGQEPTIYDAGVSFNHSQRSCVTASSNGAFPVSEML